MIISHVVPVNGNFSNSLLTDSAFYSFICDHISDLSNCLGGIPSVKSWWLFLSVSLQADIVSLVSTKRKNLSHEHVVLTNRLIVCKQRLAQGDNSVVSGIVTLKLRLILNLLHCAPPPPLPFLKVRKFVAEPNGLIKATKALGLSLLVSTTSDPDDSSFFLM